MAFKCMGPIQGAHIGKLGETGSTVLWQKSRCAIVLQRKQQFTVLFLATGQH